MKKLFIALCCMLPFVQTQTLRPQVLQSEPIHDLSKLNRDFARGIYYTDQTWFIELLQGAHKSPASPRRYLQAVFKTFTNVVKNTDCVTTDSFIETLAKLNEFLPPYMQPRQYESYLQTILDRDLEIYQRLLTFNRALLLNSFNNYYDDFRTNPIQFLQNIAEILAQAAQEELEITKLRAAIKLFLELHLNKLIWASEDNEGCWEQVKLIAYYLALFIDNNILEDLNDLDDLFWSLIHRFGHFFEYAYKNCDIKLFEAIKYDLAHSSLLLLELEEHDPCIEKRSDCLLHTIMHAEARKRAHDINLTQQQA